MSHAAVPFRTVHALVAALVAVAGIAAAEVLAVAYAEFHHREEHERRLLKTAEVRARLESSLNSTVFLAHGLGAYVASVRDPTAEQAQRALKSLYESDPNIRNVGLAPDNVIRFVYPVEGNEKAIGLRFADRPDQWPGVRLAVETRQSVLTGPIDLVQGGRAIVNRTPVYLDDQTYWGLVSTVIDIGRLVKDAGLETPAGELRFALYGGNPGASAARIFGDGQPRTRSSISLPIKIPGGQWTLLSHPVNVAVHPFNSAWVARIVLYTTVLLAALFVFTVLRSRARALAMATQLQAVNRGLASANEELRKLSRRDPLTSILNRRAFDEALADAWLACSRDQVALSILLIDVDRFKTINDRFGHAAGDATLVEISAAIRSQLRLGEDLVARYGGEEFIVLCAGISVGDLAALAERIRATAAECRVQLPGDDGVGEPITVSIGTATEIPALDRRARELIVRADAAMYRAKAGGRNRVVVGDASGTSLAISAIPSSRPSRHDSPVSTLDGRAPLA